MRRTRRRFTPVLALAGAALLALGAVALAAGSAGAATLHLAGPAGAAVRVNGSMVGFLPLAEPLVMPPGRYEVTCEVPGFLPHRETVRFVQDDQRRHVTIRLLPYSRSTAVFSNLAVAGAGPRYLGHSRRGWLYTAAEAGGLLAALFGEMSRSSAQEEYLLAMDAYGQAIEAGEIAELRAAADAKYRDAADAADMRDLGLLVAGGAIVASMLDSWLSFGAVTGGAGELPGAGSLPGAAGPATSAAPAGASFHTAVRLGF